MKKPDVKGGMHHVDPMVNNERFRTPVDSPLWLPLIWPPPRLRDLRPLRGDDVLEIRFGVYRAPRARVIRARRGRP